MIEEYAALFQEKKEQIRETIKLRVKELYDDITYGIILYDTIKVMFDLNGDSYFPDCEKIFTVGDMHRGGVLLFIISDNKFDSIYWSTFINHELGPYCLYEDSPAGLFRSVKTWPDELEKISSDMLVIAEHLIENIRVVVDGFID